VKVGDLVTFCPEAWGTPLDDRPVGIVMAVEANVENNINFNMASVWFADDAHQYSSRIADFEVLNEDW